MDEQSETIAFLSKPQSYGLAQGPVERHETHGAIVFLAGDRAYKLKRAVRYPYMDFSTPEKRRRMCEAELVINRRTAPDLYLEVRAILRGASGHLRFGHAGDGAILDWVVVMRRFDNHRLLESLRRKGRLSAETMRPLAEAIATFHRSAERCPQFGGADGIASVIAENRSIFESRAGRMFPEQDIALLSDLSHAALERLKPRLDARKRDGFVRRCHGDLHLNNICMIGGRPVLFDAIEFNEAFSCIDVFYDLAFLLMDLDRHGLRGHANILLNRYLECTGDHDGLAGLALFLSCRAAIRAHVSAAMADVASGKGAAGADAQTLFRLAIRYLQPPRPRLVAVSGLSGSGKSTLARALAPHLGPAPGAVVIRSDVLRKQMMGAKETAPLPEDAYTPEANARVYGAMNDCAARILAMGHAVVVDAVFAKPEERKELESVATEKGVAFDGLWLEAAPDIMGKRISGRRGDASDATIEVLRRQLAFVNRPEDWIRIDASGAPEVVATEARRHLHAAVQSGSNLL